MTDAAATLSPTPSLTEDHVSRAPVAREGAAGRVLMSSYRWTHYATLLVGLLLLVYIGSKQWFFFDEWDIIWQPEAARRFTQGHNGHWSAVPIAIWSALQHVFGLSSYLPFISTAVLAHLTTAHLIWRLMLRAGSEGWVATALATVFIFFGAAAENLLWAFQLGFMGAIAFGLGAVLIAMRPRTTIGSIIAIATLLLLGAATSGTALPLFVAVAWTLLLCHGWRTTLITMIVPTALYGVWYVFLRSAAGTDAFKVQSISEALTGIPSFIGNMLVGGFDASTPIPGFGIIMVTALASWALFVVRGRRWSPSTAVTSGMLISGVVFAAMTAYSRLALGVDYADESRYIYLAVMTTLPAIALMLSWCARTGWPARLLVLSLIGVVFVYNVGLLDKTARAWADRERNSHADISAALDLADRFPEQVQWDAKPEPSYVPRTLEQLHELERDFGLTRIAPGITNALSAQVQVGLAVTPSALSQSCDAPLSSGQVIPVTAQPLVLFATDDSTVTLAAVAGTLSGSEKTFTFDAGANALSSVEPTALSIRSVTGDVAICSQ